MAEIVTAVGASHAPGLVGLFDGAPQDSKEVVESAYGAITRELHESNLDVLVVMANDHLANSRVRSFPDFLLGLAEEHKGPNEWFSPWIGCRDYTLQGDRDVAEALFLGLGQRGVRMFASHDNLRYDDNLSIPAVLCELDRPGSPRVVPILQNCTVPPIPDQYASYRFGEALAKTIREDLPDGLRVGLFGSGGLSHEPGGARYFFIDEEFDKWFLDALVAGEHAKLLSEMGVQRLNEAGAGGTTELYAWLDVLGAIGEAPCEVLGYTAYENWKCGVGAVRWQVDAAKPAGKIAPGQGGAQQAATGQAAATEGPAFNPALAGHDLVQDLKWNPELRAQFERDEGSVLDLYALRPRERAAIERRDFRELYDLGFHPYLGGQLARLIYGNEAGKGATVAVEKLVESLTGNSVTS